MAASNPFLTTNSPFSVGDGSQSTTGSSDPTINPSMPSRGGGSTTYFDPRNTDQSGMPVRSGGTATYNGNPATMPVRQGGVSGTGSPATPGASPPGAAPAPVDPYSPAPVYNTQLEDLFNQMGGQYNDPTAMSKLLSLLQSQSTHPTNSQGAYGAGQDALGGPTASQGYFAGNSAAYGTPGAAEGNYAAHSGDYGNVNASANANTNAMAALGGPNALDKHADAIGAGFNSATNVGAFAGRNGGAYDTTGSLESFAASDLNGTNPYYKMLQQEGTDAINQQLNARGLYGSGGALAALAKFTGNLSAQQYQQEGQLQGQAQSAQMNRLGQGANLAGQVSGETMNRNSALEGLYNQQFQDTNAAQNTLIGAGHNEDQSKLDALSGLTTMANSAQTGATNRLIAGSNAASASDASNVNAQNALNSLAANADSSANARNATLVNAGQGADTQGLNRLNSMFDQAGKAEGAANQRIDDQLSNYMKAAGLDVSAIQSAYAQGGGLSGQQLQDQINAVMQSAAFQSAGTQARQKMVMDLFKTGVSAAAAA